MAPEQVFGERVAETADLYSVGVMFYRLLTGALPFAADTPLEMLQQQVDAASDTDLALPQRSAGMVRHDRRPGRSPSLPSDRFQSAGAFRVGARRGGGPLGPAKQRAVHSFPSRRRGPRRPRDRSGGESSRRAGGARV